MPPNLPRPGSTATNGACYRASPTGCPTTRCQVIRSIRSKRGSWCSGSSRRRSGFAELRQELRDAGRGELLAELCATWAQHERDPLRAADAWSEAGEAMVVLGETATAIEYLRTALELDPTNDRAADRLLEIVEPSDPAAAVEIIELELAELREADARRRRRKRKAELIARRAAQHRRAAELWNDHLGRVDRALWHWQQAWKLEPQRTRGARGRAPALRLARRRRDGRASCTRPSSRCSATRRRAAARKAQIRLELGKLALRGKDLEAAANHLEEAAKLDPTSLEIAEKLAEVYASPGFRDGQTRAQGGRAVRRARPPAPRDARRSDRHQLPAPRGRHRSVLEGQLAARSRRRCRRSSQWDELDRILRHRSAVVTGSGRARRGAAPARRAVPQPAAESRRADRGADRARSRTSSRAARPRASCASCCATIRTGTRCRG